MHRCASQQVVRHHACRSPALSWLHRHTIRHTQGGHATAPLACTRPRSLGGPPAARLHVQALLQHGCMLLALDDSNAQLVGGSFGLLSVARVEEWQAKGAARLQRHAAAAAALAPPCRLRAWRSVRQARLCTRSGTCMSVPAYQYNSAKVGLHTYANLQGSAPQGSYQGICTQPTCRRARSASRSREASSSCRRTSLKARSREPAPIAPGRAQPAVAGLPSTLLAWL